MIDMMMIAVVGLAVAGVGFAASVAGLVAERRHARRTDEDREKTGS